MAREVCFNGKICKSYLTIENLKKALQKLEIKCEWMKELRYIVTVDYKTNRFIPVFIMCEQTEIPIIYPVQLGYAVI